MNRPSHAAVAPAVTFRWILPLASIVACALTPAIAGATGGECMATVSADRDRADEPSEPSAGARVVYLNRHGGRTVAGNEDSSQNRSGVLWMRSMASADVPAWSRSDASWTDLVSCVEDRFSAYDVQIVDERPQSGGYVMAMIGGGPSLLGLGRSVGGIAPYSGRVIGDAIVFVFEQSIGDSQSRCEATAHEIGHALGLDHSSLCSDIMSYGSCGPKAFHDQSVACGENSARECSNGRARQNSHAMLASHVGLRTSAPVPTPTPPPLEPPRRRQRVPGTLPPAVAARLPGWRAGNDTGPRVQIQAASRSQPGDSEYRVQLRARDPDGIAIVELLWTDGQRAYRLQCGRSHDALPVSCARRGDVYTFALEVGRGERAFVVLVTDGRGQVSMTKPRGVSLY